MSRKIFTSADGPTVGGGARDDDEAYDAEALINTSDRRVPCLRAKEPNIIVRGDCRERAETVTRPFVKMIAWCFKFIFEYIRILFPNVGVTRVLE